MARTFIRQDTQIRNSDVYDDTIAPSLANFETSPTEIEGDLNNIRSMLSHLLDVQAGNWYDVINTPSTLDPGSQRGVSNLNTDLHLLERKRVLVASCSLADVVVPAAVAATGSIDCDSGGTAVIPLDTETFVLNDGVNPAVTFEFDTDGSVVQTATLRQVDISLATTDNDVRDAIIAAVNGAPTLAITASSGGAGIVSLVNDVTGSFGNRAITDTVTGASFVVTGMSGGAGDLVTLTTGQLPPNTTAAVGAVTTRGTVVATATVFGTAGLAEVAGTTAIAPKSICEVVDGSTRDEILSSARVVYGLLQGSSDLADGDTILATGGADRVQVSFVRLTATGDDLELVPASDMAGKTINLCFTERKALEDLNEADFLRGATVDIPGAQTVTRQLGYDNQGTTPVDVTTHSILDLEGPGLYWEIRDDLQATLFRITEGSAGGTSTILFGTDVDTFDSSAQVNDFDQGIRVDTGGQRINVGETAGLIESTGANDLRILGAGELYLDDGNQAGSTWAQTAGIKLSDTTAEWNAFETAFGEVSLLNAIVQAANPGNARLSKTYANVTVTTAANNDVSLADGNLDAALPDMSTGTFLQDYDVFLNGELLRPGANNLANNDYYPGTSLGPGPAQLMFEFTVKINDVLCVIAYS